MSVTTDGAPNMIGKHIGFVKLLAEEAQHPIVQFHFHLHQQALCAKASMKSFENISSVVTKIVNFISVRVLSSK